MLSFLYFSWNGKMLVVTRLWYLSMYAVISKVATEKNYRNSVKIILPTLKCVAKKKKTKDTKGSR